MPNNTPDGIACPRTVSVRVLEVVLDPCDTLGAIGLGDLATAALVRDEGWLLGQEPALIRKHRTSSPRRR
jgi:hypothetical protein